MRILVAAATGVLGRATLPHLKLEQTALESPLEVLMLRFGRLWGPAFYQEPPEPPSIHIDGAGTQAAALITSGPAGTYVIT